MNNNSKVLLGLGAGLLIGGVLGVLFAPDKGTATRKKIADSGKKLAADIGDTISKGKTKIAAVKDRIKDELDMVNDKVEEII